MKRPGNGNESQDNQNKNVDFEKSIYTMKKRIERNNSSVNQNKNVNDDNRSYRVIRDCSLQSHSSIGSDEKIMIMHHSDNCHCINPFERDKPGYYYYDGDDTIHFSRKKEKSYFSQMALPLFLMIVVFVICKYIEFLYNAK